MSSKRNFAVYVSNKKKQITEKLVNICSEKPRSALVLYLSRSGGSRGDHTFRSSIEIYGAISKKLNEDKQKKIKKEIADLLVEEGKYFCPLKW